MLTPSHHFECEPKHVVCMLALAAAFYANTQSKTIEPGKCIHFHFHCSIVQWAPTNKNQSQKSGKTRSCSKYACVLLILKLKILIAKSIFLSLACSQNASTSPVFYMRVFNLLMCSKCHRKHDIVIRAHNVIIISLIWCGRVYVCVCANVAVKKFDAHNF